MASSPTEPLDNVVRKAILLALDEINTENIRPNKLRKIVCKKVANTNWSQYARVLDLLVEQQEIRITEIGGEKVVVPPASNPRIEKDSKEEGNGPNLNSSQSKLSTSTMQIPCVVAHHLQRKGHAKRKNIEKNTKTKLCLDSVADENDMNKQSLLTITAVAQPQENGTSGDHTTVELLQKRIKSASVLIDNMITSFKKNPHHFGPKKAGGTIAEQEKARKIKEEIIKKRYGKRRTAQGSIEQGDKTNSDRISKTNKKKRRKFY